ncbi:ricin-type beta-trefoil lectin domain protein [Streptomyces cyanogenus]|uniref:Ricin-type beta-trefoil lectin domain protein n=1 Tax=Streptomyces cyanogenus TaxID=80860 RepID=A0ABX7U394_STRCY|nr:ricin-type beta-trefoil lectin domain protein [Streptomyces cyanogenus]QTE02639.1 Ricin-type beta-trefoil lectin domain protein [Streptomyces cyanogenus]
MTEAGLSDEQLSAELKKWTGASPALHPVGELLDRHWAAAFAYARLCTDGPRAAGMLTTAAFTRLFGASLRQTGPTAAWRPQVLVAVRRIAAEWDTDGRQELLHPGLRSGDGPGERAAARLLPPPERRLLSRAFQRIPETSRAVLWHVEVEAEPLAVPAALLGLDEEDTRVELGRARERLREECLQVHRELAPEAECRRYLRMLDVTFRRGGTDIDPDLRQHLAGCAHCERTAGQLAEFNGTGLGLALAEAVLGWGAHGYVESRAVRAEEPAAPVPAAAAVVPQGGEAFTEAAPAEPAAPAEHAVPGPGTARRRAAGRGVPPARRRTSGSPAPAGGTEVTAGTEPATSPRSAHRAARRARRRTLALAVVTVSGLVVLPLALWSALGSPDGPAPGAAGTPSRTPGKDRPSPGASWAGRNTPGQGTLHGRLRNLASGLCIGVVGGQAAEGAETELADCSAAPSQQWTYETDGLLRNTAAPDLCLDSHLGYSVRLAPCTATGKAARDIRYDFTLQGALVPQANQGLALTPSATDGSGALVLKIRAAGTVQRWSVDTAHPDLRMENVNWHRDNALASTPPAPPTTPGPAAPTPSRTAGPTPTPSATTSAPAPSPTTSADPCARYPQNCGWGGGGWDGGGGRHRR